MELGRGKQDTLGHSAPLLERIHHPLRFFTDGPDEPVVPDRSPAVSSGSAVDRGGSILENIRYASNPFAKNFHGGEAFAVAEGGNSNGGDLFTDGHAFQSLAMSKCKCADGGYALGYRHYGQSVAGAEGMTSD